MSPARAIRFPINEDAAISIHFIAKTYGKLPHELIDPMELFSPMERFEIDRHIHHVGMKEEERITKEAIAEAKRESEKVGRKKPKRRRRK